MDTIGTRHLTEWIQLATQETQVDTFGNSKAPHHAKDEDLLSCLSQLPPPPPSLLRAFEQALRIVMSSDLAAVRLSKLQT